MHEQNAEQIILTKLAADMKDRLCRLQQRGVQNRDAEADEFCQLMKQQEFRNMVVGELYEAYFPPHRHEHEWEFINQVVTAMWSPAGLASLILGFGSNATFALLIRVLNIVRSKLREVAVKNTRSESFAEMVKNVEALVKFFANRHMARISEIEQETGIPQAKLAPLLKLLGCRHIYQSDRDFWSPLSPIKIIVPSKRKRKVNGATKAAHKPKGRKRRRR